MGIGLYIGDNPSIIDTLWETAGQVINILLKGGDLKNLIKYF